MPNSWFQTLKLYSDIRLLWIFLMGMASGFPFALIGSNLSGWLKDEGISRGDIGALGSVALIYAFNFLWAPLIDRVPLPGLSRFGQRRSWILLMQMLLLMLLLAIAQVSPSSQLALFGVLAALIALCSATQDIAIDAFRIDQFSPAESDKMPAAAAMSVIGWWSGYSWPGYLAFSSADQIGWNQVYLLMAGVLVALIIATLWVKEPKTERDILQKKAEASVQHDLHLSRESSWLLVTVLEPFRDFFRRNGVRIALSLLLFIFLFKIGEAFLGRMSIVFYREVGFSNEQIGQYSKMFGWVLTVIFTLIGSLFNTRFGVVRGLMVGGVAMAASNLMFALMAQLGPHEWLFALTLIVDNFTGAFASVAMVAFLSAITGRAFSATQYALLASLGNLGRTSLAGLSGYLIDWLGSWSLFFIVTTIMVLPSLILLWGIRHRISRLIEQD
ncbi:AmpG family muropeptide MFS transporter [Halioxenophilus sp. WMMB6]|uniref:AmpG family muropeptide MFS transporter n=1 Tax=Halioxenophilus sp. WMMB6 TaxID=3073815 RepID=UPI00398BF106